MGKLIDRASDAILTLDSLMRSCKDYIDYELAVKQDIRNEQRLQKIQGMPCRNSHCLDRMK